MLVSTASTTASVQASPPASPPTSTPDATHLAARRGLLLAGCAATLALPRLARAASHTLPANLLGTQRLELPAAGFGVNADPMPVHLHRPASWRTHGQVLVVLHGTQRNAEHYLANWRPLAESNGVLLVVPEFSNAKFPRRSRYNFAQMVDDALQPQPRERWTFGLIDAAFALARLATGATREDFVLYGHSAGAQLVHRYLLLAERSAASLIVSANAGSYTVPDFDIAFPWGLKNTAVTADDLKRAFLRPVVVALGDADTDPNHASLPRDAAAQAQGPHRLARGQHFFERARRQAAALAAPFAWQQHLVSGVAHDDAGMGRSVMRLIVAEQTRPRA